MDQSFLSSGKSVALDEKEIAHSDLTNFRRIPQNVIVVASVGGALRQVEPFPNLNSGHSGPFCPSRPKSCALFYVPVCTAQGGGGSFKDRKPIGEVRCCESWMAEQTH